MKSQNKNFELNESICYCSGKTSPPNIVKLDNNWKLLLALRNKKSTKQLDSLEVKYTLSQLKILELWGLLEVKNKFYQTTIPILDSVKSQDLRRYSKFTSSRLSNKIKPEVLQLKEHLKKIKREKNLYSILFSYVIDGMIWKYFEDEKLINHRELNIDKPFWDGEFWTLYPKRNFSCGTNSISKKGYAMKINWSEDIIPKMIPFVTRFDLQERIVDDFIVNGKLIDSEAKKVFEKFNFFNEKGNFTVPIIVENSQDMIYLISRNIVQNIVCFIKSDIDIEKLKKTYNFKNNSQALIILYHEMIWDIMLTLEHEKIIEKPIAFKNPEQVKAKDIGDLIIMVKKKQ